MMVLEIGVGAACFAALYICRIRPALDEREVAREMSRKESS